MFEILEERGEKTKWTRVLLWFYFLKTNKLSKKELLIEKIRDDIQKDVYLMDEDEDYIDFREDENSYLDSLDDEDYENIDDVINGYLFF